MTVRWRPPSFLDIFTRAKTDPAGAARDLDQAIQLLWKQQGASAAEAAPTPAPSPASTPAAAASGVSVNWQPIAAPNFNDVSPAAETGYVNTKFRYSGSNVSVEQAVMTGDSGTGGTAGLVPAPSAGDAAASKFLKASGAWVTVVAGVTSVFGRTGAVTAQALDYPWHDEVLTDGASNIIYAGGDVVMVTHVPD